MLNVTIKDLKVRLSNSNLPIENSVICFELLVQKKEIGK